MIRRYSHANSQALRCHRLVLTGLLAGSGVAWAQTDEEDVIEIEDSEDVTDTLFNFGYDLINRLFLWNLSALDGIYDCTLENGPLTATYGETSDTGLVPVDNLEGAAGVVQFPNRPAGRCGRRRRAGRFSCVVHRSRR